MASELDEAMVERARVAFCAAILAPDCESREAAEGLIVGDVRDAIRAALRATSAGSPHGE